VPALGRYPSRAGMGRSQIPTVLSTGGNEKKKCFEETRTRRRSCSCSNPRNQWKIHSSHSTTTVHFVHIFLHAFCILHLQHGIWNIHSWNLAVNFPRRRTSRQKPWMAFILPYCAHYCCSGAIVHHQVRTCAAPLKAHIELEREKIVLSHVRHKLGNVSLSMDMLYFSSSSMHYQTFVFHFPGAFLSQLTIKQKCVLIRHLYFIFREAFLSQLTIKQKCVLIRHLCFFFWELSFLSF
jgi:hypothetical protein